MSRKTDSQEPQVAFRAHDHAHCIGEALSKAETACRRKNLRFTELRHRVLEILLESHTALGAYDVLERLRGEGRAAQPPIAYRTLDFLVEHGFAHKIEGMNAFVACNCSDERHRAALLVCRSCKTVAEAPIPAGAGGLTDIAEKLGFRIDRTLVEAEGLCPSCRKAEG